MSKPEPKKKNKLNKKEINITDITLSVEQKKLFDKLENTKEHTFVTGKAGTGKSVLLQYFKEYSNKRLVVVAPTGVAALNVGGQTIHSLFRIPPTFIAQDSLQVHYKTALLLKNLDAVVLDEISMVRADLMDAIDHLLRQARSSKVPFGGVQVIMFGDLYQLPPIVSDPELHKYFAENYGGYYFFRAHAWQSAALKIYELTNIFRQKGKIFKIILNAIRTGEVTQEALAKLNSRTTNKIPEDGVITLATTNNTVTNINHIRLDKLEGRLYEYRAMISGELEQSAFPTEEVLRFKKGAQVMLLKNDREKRWVNGTLGHIHSLSKDEVKVDIGGSVYSVPRETWSKIRYYYDREENVIEEEVVSSFTQFPLRLAWAITIHKSQGQTYNSIAVDLGSGAFAQGQTYVALSRCRSLKNLYLKREVSREDIMVDPTVVSFMGKINKLRVSKKKKKKE